MPLSQKQARSEPEATEDYFFKLQIFEPHYVEHMGWGASGHSYIFKSSPTDRRILGNFNQAVEESPRMKVFPQ